MSGAGLISNASTPRSASSSAHAFARSEIHFAEKKEFYALTARSAGLAWEGFYSTQRHHQSAPRSSPVLDMSERQQCKNNSFNKTVFRGFDSFLVRVARLLLRVRGTRLSTIGPRAQVRPRASITTNTNTAVMMWGTKCFTLLDQSTAY